MELPLFDTDSTNVTAHRVQVAATTLASAPPLPRSQPTTCHTPRSWDTWITHYQPFPNEFASTLGLIINDVPVLYTDSEEEMSIISTTNVAHVWTYFVLKDNRNENILMAGRQPGGYGYVITLRAWSDADEAVFVPGML